MLWEIWKFVEINVCNYLWAGMSLLLLFLPWNLPFSEKYALQQHKNGREEWESKSAFGLKSLTWSVPGLWQKSVGWANEWVIISGEKNHGFGLRRIERALRYLARVNVTWISSPLYLPQSVRLLSYKAMKLHKRGLKSLLSNDTKLIFKFTGIIFYILAAKFTSQWNWGRSSKMVIRIAWY